MMSTSCKSLEINKLISKFTNKFDKLKEKMKFREALKACVQESINEFDRKCQAMNIEDSDISSAREALRRGILDSALHFRKKRAFFVAAQKTVVLGLHSCSVMAPIAGVATDVACLFADGGVATATFTATGLAMKIVGDMIKEKIDEVSKDEVIVIVNEIFNKKP